MTTAIAAPPTAISRADGDARSRGASSARKAAGAIASRPNRAGSPSASAPTAPSRVPIFQQVKTAMKVAVNAVLLWMRDRHGGCLVDDAVRGDGSARAVHAEQWRKPQAVERVAGAEEECAANRGKRAATRSQHAHRSELRSAGEGRQ